MRSPLSTTCPECGSRLIAIEFGTYGGKMSLNPDGSINWDSFSETWSEFDSVKIVCDNYSCGFEELDIDVDR